MELRYWNDPETELPHIYDHGVTEEEVQQVMNRPGEEFPGRDQSRIRLGPTLAGRYLQVVYVPDAGRPSAFVVTAFELLFQGQTSLPETPEEKTAMKRAKKQKLPAGWTEERIRQLAQYYDHQSEDGQVAEHETALQAEGHTVMVVPTELVPEILKLLTKKRTA